jgi:ABC-type branched-subunit amino acid transport system ATPase component
MLNIADLVVRYGRVRAVDGVCLVVETGTLVGLIGPNGAGKTTLMDAVGGLVPATGSITLDGELISALPAHKRARAGLGRTFQSLELFEELTVRENMLVAAERPRWWSPVSDLIRPRPQRRTLKAVAESLELLGLCEVAEAAPSTLSLGQRKLVTIARALSAQPKLLLLDEPAAGLDADESISLGATLRDVVAAGTAILLADHDMGLILGSCDHIYAVDFGKAIASGTPDEIRKDEQVIHSYLGAAAEAEVTQQTKVPS